jgi:hypothetical protein
VKLNFVDFLAKNSGHKIYISIVDYGARLLFEHIFDVANILKNNFWNATVR